jgi:hypothetical protein
MGKCLSILAPKNKSTTIQPLTIMSNVGEVDDKLMLKKLKEFFGEYFIDYLISDTYYNLHNMEDIKRFLKETSVNLEEYKDETFDCDDFSFVLLGEERKWYRNSLKVTSTSAKLKGSAFGVIWGDIRQSPTQTEPFWHACNMFIDENFKIWLIEPQTDMIHEFYPGSRATKIII